MSNSKKKLVPASKDALYRMKYEIAAELGLSVAQHGVSSGYGDTEFAGELGSIPTGNRGMASHDDWGHLTSRDVGAVGGEITRRLIAQAEQFLKS